MIRQVATKTQTPHPKRGPTRGGLGGEQKTICTTASVSDENHLKIHQTNNNNQQNRINQIPNNTQHQPHKHNIPTRKIALRHRLVWVFGGGWCDGCRVVGLECVVGESGSTDSRHATRPASRDDSYPPETGGFSGFPFSLVRGAWLCYGSRCNQTNGVRRWRALT